MKLSLVASVASASVVEKAMLPVHSDWMSLADADGLEHHEVTFAIKQLNIDALQKKLMDVSDPDSANRGKYLTHAEVNSITSNPQAVEVVESFLLAHGIKHRKLDPHGNYISATSTVAKWEEMFNTDLQHVAAKSDPSKLFMRAVTDVHLPEEIVQHLDGIFRLASLPRDFRPMPKVGPANTNAATVTPAGLKKFYNVEGSGSPSQSQCVFEGLGQYTSPKDLKTFQASYDVSPALPIANDIGGHVSTNGRQCLYDPNTCAEANLDVQYMNAMAPETPLTFWYVGDQQTPFEDFVEQVEASTNPPLVNSISYGAVEELVPLSVIKAFDIAAMKLGIQGVTVFVSSGDDGVANFQARANQTNCGYHPSYPASSPWVTAVGATQGGIIGGDEIVCSSDTGGQITTGGGFSTQSDMPDYQAEAVKAYLASTEGGASVPGYANGRGYPDIAMAGFNYDVVIGGQPYPVSGTSASSPVVAGFASLVNAKLAASGGSSLGFINPTLYKAGSSSFNDITSGNNKCCASTVCCTEGFSATTGWDPLTGLGSVDYLKFEALFTSDSVTV